MSDKPNIVGSHVLVNINQDQHSREKDAEQDISPLRYRVGRKDLRKEQYIYEQNDPGKKERKQQEVEIHLLVPPTPKILLLVGPLTNLSNRRL